MDLQIVSSQAQPVSARCPAKPRPTSLAQAARKGSRPTRTCIPKAQANSQAAGKPFHASPPPQSSRTPSASEGQTLLVHEQPPLSEQPVPLSRQPAPGSEDGMGSQVAGSSTQVAATTSGQGGASSQTAVAQNADILDDWAGSVSPDSQTFYFSDLDEGEDLDSSPDEDGDLDDSLDKHGRMGGTGEGSSPKLPQQASRQRGKQEEGNAIKSEADAVPNPLQSRQPVVGAIPSKPAVQAAGSFSSSQQPSPPQSTAAAQYQYHSRGGVEDLAGSRDQASEVEAGSVGVAELAGGTASGDVLGRLQEAVSQKRDLMEMRFMTQDIVDSLYESARTKRTVPRPVIEGCLELMGDVVDALSGVQVAQVVWSLGTLTKDQKPIDPIFIQDLHLRTIDTASSMSLPTMILLFQGFRFYPSYIGPQFLAVYFENLFDRHTITNPEDLHQILRCFILTARVSDMVPRWRTYLQQQVEDQIASGSMSQPIFAKIMFDLAALKHSLTPEFAQVTTDFVLKQPSQHPAQVARLLWAFSRVASPKLQVGQQVGNTIAYLERCAYPMVRERLMEASDYSYLLAAFAQLEQDISKELYHAIQDALLELEAPAKDLSRIFTTVAHMVSRKRYPKKRLMFWLEEQVIAAAQRQRLQCYVMRNVLDSFVKLRYVPSEELMDLVGSNFQAIKERVRAQEVCGFVRALGGMQELCWYNFREDFVGDVIMAVQRHMGAKHFGQDNQMTVLRAFCRLRYPIAGWQLDEFDECMFWLAKKGLLDGKGYRPYQFIMKNHLIFQKNVEGVPVDWKDMKNLPPCLM